MDRLPKHITLKHIHAFIAVAEEGGFTAAAQRLHQTQSSLTMLIQQMEGALGCRMFERSSRKVTLTEIGRSFLPRAIHLLKEFEGAVDDVIRYGALQRGQVTVAAAPSAITTLLSPVVHAFSTRYPGIRIYLRDENSRQIQEMVNRGEADFGLTSRWLDDAALRFEPCMSDQFGILYPAEFRRMASRIVRWTQLAGHKQIGLIDETGIQSILRSRIDLPRETTAPFYEASSTTSQAALVRTGMGLAVLPALAASRVLGQGLHFKLLDDPRITRTLAVITHAERPPTPMAQALLDMVWSSMKRFELPSGCVLISRRNQGAPG